MPGGLLVVEAVLVPGLVSSGMNLPDAISAMLIYRLVSWIFISAIGWVVFFFMFRTEGALHPDRAVDDLAAAEMYQDPPPNRRRTEIGNPTPAGTNRRGRGYRSSPMPSPSSCSAPSVAAATPKG